MVGVKMYGLEAVLVRKLGGAAGERHTKIERNPRFAVTHQTDQQARQEDHVELS